ncbi:chitinase [Actinacidiphila bryophytorum]|uniref:chitinase n=1 Tax=Actinacidiphila bryophytorum TaxID=1436133 RepID=A0A9W4E6F2_9ACTN|nr:carbohydrate binding domain-containing protein [Actinacidiphila bryophytorum]MBN6544325.1 carbohydrate binding domain-containing protein [Actinacidiphila bryophytorum]CAG7602403.1 Chitinase [Actinacidiphila bryophytorum]
MERASHANRTSHTHRRSTVRQRTVAALSAAAVIGAGVAVVTVGSASAATTNLVANPGFESGLSNWTCTAGSGAAVSSPVHSGSAALKATPSNSDTGQCSQTVSVQPNSQYTLSAWVQGSYVYIGASGTGGTDPSTWTPGASSYQQLSVNFTTGASTHSVTVYTHGWYAQPAYFADDITLSGPGGSTTPPTTPTTTPPTTPTTTPPTTPTTTPPTTTPPSTGLPKHVVTGYWQNFDNGATVQTIAQVQSQYDIIAVAFADATTTPGAVSFTLDPSLGYSVAQFKADIAAKQAAGKKVIVSVGGQNGTISVRDSASATNFANSVYSLMQTYGFNGVDIDLENGIDSTYMPQALRALSAKAGSGLIITMAPQTIDMLSAGSDYLATALKVKDILTIVNTQYYNSGSMNGCDGGVYSQGSVDFITTLACTAIQAGLSPSQVGIGTPASTSAAGSGYVSPSVVDNALDCLAKGTGCGSFHPSTTWPGIGGAMTWSTNWDASAGNTWSNGVGPHVHSMP